VFVSPLRQLRHLIGVLGLVCLSAGSVRAQDPVLRDPLARELKDAGDRAMTSLRYAEALDDYERATAIEPHPVLLFNRGRALQALQRYPEALEHFEAFQREASADLVARAGQLGELMERLRDQVGRVELVCDAPGATVLVRGVKVGVTPLARPLQLNAGPAHVSVLADGRVPYERDVVIAGRGELRLEVRLAPIKPRGRVVVRSTVSGAVVFVDGQRLGVVPAEVALPAGRHRVRLEHSDFTPGDSTFEIADGDNKVVSLPLERRQGILSKWWFWTGAGVVLASGAVVAIALTSERSADRGDIAPGVVSAPLTRF
jgi:hypothetical protein